MINVVLNYIDAIISFSSVLLKNLRQTYPNTLQTFIFHLYHEV